MSRLNHGVEQSMKGSDLWQDAKNCKQKKRDNGGAEAFSFGKKDGQEDEDYRALLDALENYINDDEEDNRGYVDDDNVDPDYKIFFDNLREDGHSYVFEMDKGDGTRILVKFEEENGSEGGGVDDVRKRGVDHERCRGVKRNGNGNGTEFRSLLMDVDAGMLAQADENYLMFLSRAWVVGDRLVYEDEDGVIRYEVDDGMPGATEGPEPVEETSAEEEDDDDEANSDDDDEEEDGDEEEDEEYEIDFPSYTEKEFTPVTTLKTDNNVIVDIADDDDDDIVPLGGFYLNSEFLEKLRKELQKPFKLKEYKRKMKEASVHRPLDRAREFRGGLRKSYRTPLTSLSYFYRYPDLAHKVELALQNKEKNRALALLRCLFLYLKNLPHGVSKPWEHPSVLEWVQCPSILDSAHMKHEASPKVLLPC